MEIFRDYRNLPDHARGAVVVIGNFDGVHRGHQALLAQAGAVARGKRRKLAALTFEPHPRALLRPDDPPFRVTPEPLKMRRLEACGVDLVFAIPFDWPFASQTAVQFVDQVLKTGLGAAHVVVGDDFRFGQLRKGTPADIERAGIAVDTVERIVTAHEEPYSSSDVRAALRHGNIEKANALLGWPWEIEGIVAHGDKRGRELGFPTANVSLGDAIHPGYGVYASLVRIVEDGVDAPWLASATNIGIRPMFEIRTAQVETHIFDFDDDIYGKTLRIRPVRQIRGEAKFASLNELIAQMYDDCQESRAILARPLMELRA
ncbi:MAG: bifunctional riboflavin kinase/FAD synthetase [Alphaproteobacteria bacterium]|nr:bifunctional riboflavin kinase/FAD synthetase [Alphaproteobacteria bacterium]